MSAPADGLSDACRLAPIGIIHSPFKEKFGIPRQSALAPAAEATLELLPPCDRDEAVRGIEGFSHLWLLFLFHGVAPGRWSPTVRPPRLGGNRRVGVFASRSTHRPNPLGLSVVELLGVARESGRLLLHLRGVDLLDGTPVLDIKPYLPYADSIPDARAGFAPQPPPQRLAVAFSAQAAAACARRQRELPHLRALIEQVVALDPRPAYREDSDGRLYGVRLYDCDVRWRVEGERAEIVAVEPAVPAWENAHSAGSVA